MARELQIKEALDYMYDWLLVQNCRIQTRHTSLALQTFLGEFGITTFILYPMDLRKDYLQGIPTQSNIVDWLHSLHMRCLQYLFHHLHQEIHSRSSATYLVLARQNLTLDEGENYLALLAQNMRYSGGCQQSPTKQILSTSLYNIQVCIRNNLSCVLLVFT
jgi:hypothetical protein